MQSAHSHCRHLRHCTLQAHHRNGAPQRRVPLSTSPEVDFSASPIAAFSASSPRFKWLLKCNNRTRTENLTLEPDGEPLTSHSSSSAPASTPSAITGSIDASSPFLVTGSIAGAPAESKTFPMSVSHLPASVPMSQLPVSQLHEMAAQASSSLLAPYQYFCHCHSRLQA